jgi:hypothetical protein
MTDNCHYLHAILRRQLRNNVLSLVVNPLLGKELELVGKIFSKLEISLTILRHYRHAQRPA